MNALASDFNETPHRNPLGNLKTKLSPYEDGEVVIVPVPSTTGENRAPLAAALWLKEGLEKGSVIPDLIQLKSSPNIKQAGQPLWNRLAITSERDFAVSRSVEGKTLVLVDDILTTDSTTEEIRQELIRAGAKKVHVFALAKTNAERPPTVEEVIKVVESTTPEIRAPRNIPVDFFAPGNGLLEWLQQGTVPTEFKSNAKFKTAAQKEFEQNIFKWVSKIAETEDFDKGFPWALKDAIYLNPAQTFVKQIFQRAIKDRDLELLQYAGPDLLKKTSQNGTSYFSENTAKLSLRADRIFYDTSEFIVLLEQLYSKRREPSYEGIRKSWVGQAIFETAKKSLDQPGPFMNRKGDDKGFMDWFRAEAAKPSAP